MNPDQIFIEKIEKSTDFKFDAKVVNVFDDMVVRSVPYFPEIQRMMAESMRNLSALKIVPIQSSQGWEKSIRHLQAIVSGFKR